MSRTLINCSSDHDRDSQRSRRSAQLSRYLHSQLAGCLESHAYAEAIAEVTALEGKEQQILLITGAEDPEILSAAIGEKLDITFELVPDSNHYTATLATPMGHVCIGID